MATYRRRRKAAGEEFIVGADGQVEVDPRTSAVDWDAEDGDKKTSKRTRGRAADAPTGNFTPPWERPYTKNDEDQSAVDLSSLPPLTLPSTACIDWAERIVSGQALIPEPYNKERAEKALKIFDSITAVDVMGKPRMGDIARPWIRSLVAFIFGAQDEYGRQIVRQFLLLISKKNTKSTLCAYILLVALLMNEREGAEMGIIAPTKEVAGNSWKPLRASILADEYLSDILKVQDHIKTITHKVSGATLQVVAADSDTVAGKKWSITLIDELWLFGQRENADMMLMEATGGMASRPEGFVMYATTQSDEPPAGVFATKLEYARKVRDGEIEDGSFLPVLYEYPKEMIKSGQHHDIETWYITNPNLGASVDLGYLKNLYRESQEAGERSVQGFFAKHLNVEISIAKRSDRWAGADFWHVGADETLRSLDELIKRSEVAVVGIDGGGLDDLLGVSVVGREKITGRWLQWSHAWAHKIVKERRKDIVSNLLDFEKDGDLTFVENPGEDVDQLADIVKKLKDKGVLAEEKCLGVDTAGIGAIVEKLESMKYESDKHIVGIGQGWRLNGAIKTSERMVAGGKLLHGNTRLMAWCIGNAKVKLVGNAATIEKQFSGTAKIDPLLAMFDAVALMAMTPQAPKVGLRMVKLG